MKKILMFVAAVLLAASAWATTMTCSIDRSGMWFTGKTRTEMGTMLFQHKCYTSGHIFWLTSDQMNN